MIKSEFFQSIFLDTLIFLRHSKPMRCLYTVLFGTIMWWTIASQAAVSSLVADTKSGFIMEAQGATIQQPPASLTKLMTLYLVFGALDSGVLKMSDQLPISEYAASQPKSKIGVVPGETISVQDAVMALIIKSANDVATVVAEALAQDETRFADLMTQTARSLGLRDTVFKNASGLHVDGQVSTARDMAILTMAIISHYPKYYELFATPSFTYKGQIYYSHNTVLQQYDGAEGLKTGFVSAVGYNIVSTAKQGDVRLVSVVIGEDTPLKRDLRAMRLLDKGFRQVEIQKKAEENGRLKGAFNPLNRRALISKPPAAVFLPTIKLGISSCHKKLASLKKERASSVRVVKADSILTTEPASTVEQGDNWSIQVGAFEGKDKARRIAEKAAAFLGTVNKKIMTPLATNHFFRSRIHGFSKVEAHNACQRLKDASWQCFAVAPNKS